MRTPLRSDRRGIAALEFALVAPFLVILVLGIIEVSLRVRAADSFHRFLAQAGDILSREDQLFADDIQAIFDAAPDIMAPLDTDTRIDIDVASIGFDPDGNPVLLWRRARGVAPPAINLSEAAGLGDPGDSVLRVGATFRYDTPISAMLGTSRMTLTRQAYYRPRVTRVIAMDGEVHDPGVSWGAGGPGLSDGVDPVS